MVPSGNGSWSVNAWIAADDPLARSGLFSLLSLFPPLKLAGHSTFERSSAEIEGKWIDVVVWDTGPSGAVSAGAVPSLPPVVALVPDRHSAAEALLGGARGAVGREAPGPQIASAMIAASFGSSVIDPTLGLGWSGPAEPRRSGPEGLTVREAEVLELVAQGLSNKGIAQRLSISEHTAKFHVNAILSKLGARSRTEAIVRAAKAGLVSI